MSTDDPRQRLYWERDHGHREYDHPVVRFFARQRIDHIRRQMDWGSIKTALDVGCGNGFSTHYVSEHVENIWGVDRSQSMLARHPLRPTRRICLADAVVLPFPDNTFDLVYGWEVLHHISDPSVVVSEMARVSRRYVLLAEPNRSNPAQLAFALIDREHRWVLRYDLGYMRRLLQAGGLTVEWAASGGWIFPNVTPPWLLEPLARLPYFFKFGITHWGLGSKTIRQA